MRRISWTVLLGLSVLLQPLPAGARPSGSVPTAGAPLQAALRKAVADGVPGVSLAVVRHGRLLWWGGAGFADREAGARVSPQTTFGIGSITKTMVAVAAFRLAAEGRINLSATPAGLLGGQAVTGLPNVERATFLQLMNHTSGIPSWEDDPAWLRQGRGRDARPDRLWRPDETLRFARHPALAPPGDRFSYANTNYTLLGLALERSSGLPLARILRREVWAPLRLRYVFLDGFERQRSHVRASGYHLATAIFRAGAGISPAFAEVAPALLKTGAANLSSEWAAGGVVASAPDLARFGSALADGTVLTPLQRQQMMGSPLVAAPDEGGDAGAGRGIFVRSSEGTRLYYHTGGVLGFTAYFGWFEDSGTAFAILMNLGVVDTGAGGARVAMGWIKERRILAEIHKMGLRTQAGRHK